MTRPPFETMSRHHTLSDADRRLAEGVSVVLVVDDDGRLLGIVGDHELRDAAFSNTPSGAAVTEVMESAPLLISQGEGEDEARRLLHQQAAAAVVEVDDERRPRRVHRRADLLAGERLVRDAMLMVGGEGTRLRPLTDNVPKPMLPVAGVPILERIVRHLGAHGIDRITMALGYRAHQIEGHFGDGADLGAEITYVREDVPLGTAGAIGLMDARLDGPLLVMNGDILTDLDVASMALAHHRVGAAVTVAARAYNHQVPYGVFKLVGQRVVSIAEKPVETCWTNAGIYLMEHDVVASIPGTSYLDMTVLMEQVIGRGERVAAFPIREYWCDIGLPEDYARANRQWTGG